MTKKQQPPTELAKIADDQVTLGNAGLAALAALQDKRAFLQRSKVNATDDQSLWVVIRNRTTALEFERYNRFITRVLCCGSVAEKTDHKRAALDPQPCDSCYAPELIERLNGLACDTKGLPSHGTQAHELLKAATEIYILLQCGLVFGGPDCGQEGDPNQCAAEEQTRGDCSTQKAPECNNPDKLKDPCLYDEADESSRMENRGEVDRDKLADILADYLKSSSNPGALPYLDRIVEAIATDHTLVNSPFCRGVWRSRTLCPCLFELIWSYWHEEGMLAQTMKAVSLRFQNRRRTPGRDPLANFELDPLRPLNNILWGYVQDEQHRLTVQRRAYEYDHHYGLNLYGKAVPALQSADSRSKFIEAFHQLLYQCAVFYREDADTTVISDGFPLLNALKEVHIILAEGAHNQFGDLPWTARVEMLMEQWLLARPEMREFLQSRAMVPYVESWMAQVDAMKRIQGWTDTSITHFRSLGVYGEQIVLSVRYGDWVNVNDQDNARNWARYWRPEVQSYLHAYRAATGVDLAQDPQDPRALAARNAVPSVHLRSRLVAQTGKA